MIFRSQTGICRSSIIALSTTRAVAVERFGPRVCRGTAGSLSDAEIREDAAEKIFVTEFAGDFAECGERAFQFLGSQFRETSFSQAQRGSIEPCARGPQRFDVAGARRESSEEHTSELQSLMRMSYAVFCLKNKTASTMPTTAIQNN